jgi:hypothetical protein
MMRDTFGSPLRRRLSGRRSPKLPPRPFRTSPVRVVANVAVAGFVLANMILAYQLLGEDRSSIAVVRARSEHGGAGSTAFERLNEALDNLSSSKLGVPLPTTANANQAGRKRKSGVILDNLHRIETRHLGIRRELEFQPGLKFTRLDFQRRRLYERVH